MQEIAQSLCFYWVLFLTYNILYVRIKMRLMLNSETLSVGSGPAFVSFLCSNSIKLLTAQDVWFLSPPENRVRFSSTSLFTSNVGLFCGIRRNIWTLAAQSFEFWSISYLWSVFFLAPDMFSAKIYDAALDIHHFIHSRLPFTSSQIDPSRFIHEHLSLKFRAAILKQFSKILRKTT